MLRSGHLKEVPRLFLVEDEFAVAMVEAEADWVRALLEELTSGSFPDLARGGPSMTAA